MLIHPWVETTQSPAEQEDPPCFWHHGVLSFVSVSKPLVSVSFCLYLSPIRCPVSQMSRRSSRHDSTHKCLFVLLSCVQTHTLHHPVNGFVRWPFHWASQEDRQCLYQSVCVCVFQSQASRLCWGNKRPPKSLPRPCISKIPLHRFTVRQLILSLRVCHTAGQHICLFLYECTTVSEAWKMSSKCSHFFIQCSAATFNHFINRWA